MMGTIKKFESICADCTTQQNILFRMDSDYEDNYDCVDTCIIWNTINFYGVPFNLSDDQLNDIYSGDYKNAVKIGEIFGCLILCKQMIKEGYDPLEVCDDSNGDLEYTISALSDEGEPLNEDDGDSEQDVYYIHEFKMVKEYDDAPLKSRILEELPGLILSLLHDAPDILAFYPEPLEYEPDKSQEERHEVLRNIAADKIDSAFGGMIGEKKTGKDSENVVKFADAYQFSEDELNYIMGRRNPGSSYPEQAKDQKEFAFYEANGFEEIGNSRLLYKEVGRGD
jgi:hypothetical protein